MCERPPLGQAADVIGLEQRVLHHILGIFSVPARQQAEALRHFLRA
jgi:hypothetical protein